MYDSLFQLDAFREQLVAGKPVRGSLLLERINTLAKTHLHEIGSHYRQHLDHLTSKSIQKHHDDLPLIARRLSEYTPNRVVGLNILIFLEACLQEIIYLNGLLQPEAEQALERIKASRRSGEKRGQQMSAKAEEARALIVQAMNDSDARKGLTAGDFCNTLCNRTLRATVVNGALRRSESS